MRQSSELSRGELTVGRELILGLDVRKRSRVFALSPARSGTRVGSEI